MSSVSAVIVSRQKKSINLLWGEEVYNRVKCIDSDSEDCVHLGTCKNGTPVDIFRTVAEADRRILVGNVEYHYFAGYSGGMKAIMPGFPLVPLSRLTIGI